MAHKDVKWEICFYQLKVLLLEIDSSVHVQKCTYIPAFLKWTRITSFRFSLYFTFFLVLYLRDFTEFI